MRTAPPGNEDENEDDLLEGWAETKENGPQSVTITRIHARELTKRLKSSKNQNATNRASDSKWGTAVGNSKTFLIG